MRTRADNYDYMVVGLGLAGSCVALQLLKGGKKLLAIDAQVPSTSSLVAAGIFNPVTGRRMTRTWMADVLFPYLHQFYSAAEQLLDNRFYHPMPLYRPFVSVEEQNEWMGRSAESAYDGFIEKVEIEPINVDQVRNPYGGLRMQQSGYVNSMAFCGSVADFLKKKAALIQEEFDPDGLNINKNGITYGNLSASRIIFCEGERALTNKFWSWVPIRPLKGEVLTIETEEKLSMILNRGVYIVPGVNKVGATYNKHDSTRAATTASRRELTEKLEELANFAYTISGQEWAMRPTTPDRRPIMGAHPEFSQLLIFNGLGTKGVSLAPYFSGLFFDWLENGAAMNEEVDLNRYKSLYWKSA